MTSQFTQSEKKTMIQILGGKHQIMKKKNNKKLTKNLLFKTGKGLTLGYRTSDVTLLALIFEVFIETCYKTTKLNHNILNLTWLQLGRSIEKKLKWIISKSQIFFIFENPIRGGIFKRTGKRDVFCIRYWNTLHTLK